MKIAISGTPGTGKHRLGRDLSKLLGFKLLDLNKEIGSKPDRETEVSVKDLERLVKNKLEDDMIIVSHMAHMISDEYFDLLIILRCNPEVLSKRLKARGYDKEKVYDNVVFEALDGSVIETIELGKKFVQIDSTRDYKTTLRQAYLLITKNKRPRKFNPDYSRYVIRFGL